MKKRNIWIIVGVLLVIVLIVIGKNRKEDGLEVYSTKLEKRTIISTVSANGKIKPEGEIKISADVSGEIIVLGVNEGDTVVEGQLLLKIDPDLYISALDRAKANWNSAQSSFNSNLAMLSQSEARLNEQQANYDRSTKLFNENILSQAEYDAVKSLYQVSVQDVKASKERVASAKFGIANAQAGVNEATKNLARTSIYAPSEGVISALNVEQGERVVGTAQMAGTEIMVISNFNNMEVIVDVNENDILQIEKGDTTDIEVDAYSDRTFQGIVTEIARSASGLSSMQLASDQVTNFEVKIRILKSSYADLVEQIDAPFLPGMSASVEIQTEVARDVECLPIEAVTTRDSEDSTSDAEELDEVVFIIEDDKAVKVIIESGVQDSRYIQIRSGLKTEDQVISGPYEAVSKKLKNDREVEVVEKKTFRRNESD